MNHELLEQLVGVKGAHGDQALVYRPSITDEAETHMLLSSGESLCYF